MSVPTIIVVSQKDDHDIITKKISHSPFDSNLKSHEVFCNFFTLKYKLITIDNDAIIINGVNLFHEEVIYVKIECLDPTEKSFPIFSLINGNPKFIITSISYDEYIRFEQRLYDLSTSMDRIKWAIKRYHIPTTDIDEATLSSLFNSAVKNDENAKKTIDGYLNFIHNFEEKKKAIFIPPTTIEFNDDFIRHIKNIDVRLDKLEELIRNSIVPHS